MLSLGSSHLLKFLHLYAGSTFMLPKQALHSSIYAASSPEEVDIIDPSAMSNTPSPTGELPQQQIFL